MPNEKLPEINEHDAEELIHYPQDEEQKERRSRLLPGRWTRRVQKSSARAQARRRVAEKTSEDHAYLMLGAVPFWAVGATSSRWVRSSNPILRYRAYMPGASAFRVSGGRCRRSA